MDVETLITSVFVKNPLWDQKDPQHHNRFVLDKLWDAVADQIKSTRNGVRAKWKTLRDTFRKELRKMPVKRSGDGASQSTWKSSWQYFDSLSFLKDQFTPRSSTGNLPDVEGGNIVDEDTNFQLAESNLEDLDYSVNVDLPLVNSEKEKRTEPTSTPARKQLKRKQQCEDSTATALIRIEENKLRILENQHNKSSDEDESFFESLLPHVRTLTPQNKMLLRIKMQEVVYNFVYGHQQTNQHMSAPRAPSAPNICIEYQSNPTQFTHLSTSTQDYSNPTSVSSYLSNFSDETRAVNEHV